MNINHPVPPMPQLPLPPDGETSAAPATTPAAAPSSKKDVEVITDYTNRDVLNGRGQGVQRHPGNVKYRTLVFVNKTLYAKCPRSDKIKISKGIVKAIRNSGGRFLDLDERTNIYTDIGDKKATEKTSQALREGQTQIRKDAFQNKVDQSLPLLPNPPVKEPGKWEIPEHDYMKYSMEILEHLYSAEENMTAEMAARPAPHSVATQAQYLGLSQNRGHTVPQPYPIAQQAVIAPSTMPAIPTHPAHYTTMTEAQFMGLQQHLEGHPQQHPAQGRIVSADMPIQQHMRMNPNANVLPASKRQRANPSSSGPAQYAHPMSQATMMEILQMQSSNGMDPQLLECVKQTQNELRSLKKDGGTAQTRESSSVNGPSQIASAEATEPSKPSAAAAALPGQQQQQSGASSKDKKKSSVEADIAQTLLGLSRDGKEKADE